MSNRFIISDHHWGHEAIIKLENRPFSNVEEMDEFMIDEWNAVVRKKNDHVIHVGDMFVHREDIDRIMPRLNGKITLIVGNHDKFCGHMLRQGYIEKALESRMCNHDEKFKFLITHRPQNLYNMFHASVSVHGHAHGNPVDPKHFPGARHVNVCVEEIGYRPMAWEDLIPRVAAENEKADRPYIDQKNYEKQNRGEPEPSPDDPATDDMEP